MRESPLTSPADPRDWLGELAAADGSRAVPIPFAKLRRWGFHPGTGDLAHDSGGFFTVTALDVRVAHGPVEHWSQPILDQPEVGILGILAQEFAGVLHFLLQVKWEPGNCDGPQLSPTVQATRSNYTRVHGGRAVPYLHYFRQGARHRTHVDVRQSEQGSWFYRKCNRNMIVEVDAAEDVEVLDGFRWLTLGQLHRLLSHDNLVNMDARSVLACLPFPFPRTGVDPQEGILSWITEVRSRQQVLTRRVPLTDVPGWRHTGEHIAHESGGFFRVMAVDVRARGREVRGWTQPMIQPVGSGVSALLVRRRFGVVQALFSARVEAGCADVLELAPTVQCAPRNYLCLPPEARPLFLDRVLRAPAERIVFDTVLSEEGGRFYHARNRYMIIEVAPGELQDPGPGHRWIEPAGITALMRHSHYVNVEARTLMACLQTVVAPSSS
ncbi:NDP-hexose 2,3-dehydratase family protein [Streptomyces sp. NPDC046215]|uniref:NDP-hexose 2,3-dehydratase family protein n=1 Tax=Streptomyces TaxID=1883 RepID=UPI0031DEA4A5